MIKTKYFTNFKKSGGGKMRVLFFQANTFASGYYRIGFIAEELAREGQVEVDLASSFMNNKDITWKIGQADVVVFQLQTSEFISNLIDICKKNGIRTVMDMDDDLLNVPEWNPAYFGLGRNKTDFWTSEYGEMDIEKNRRTLRNIKKMLRKVDLITVTGRGLRNEYSKFNKVKILPNLVDPDRIKESKRSKGLFDKDTVRIFWQGSPTHAEDLREVRAAVKIITEKYPQVKWSIFGSGYHGFARMMRIDSKRVEHRTSVPMEKYYKTIKRMKMDIGICPLKDIGYNRCKSNIKWLEYGLLGIPAIVSDVITYTDSVTNGHDGLVAKNTNDWINCLSSLIEDPVKREYLAGNAKERILQDFNIHNKINLWADAYKRLF